MARLDPGAFARELKPIEHTLWCIAAGLTGDRDTAEDLVQQATVTALERLDAFDPDTNLLAWMAQIVRNLASNERRKERRRGTIAIAPESLDARPAAATGGAEVVDRFGTLAAGQDAFDDEILAALAQLAPVARACLLLRVVTEAPYQRIAELLEIPVGTAMSHVDRSRRRLRERLADGGEGNRVNRSPRET